MHMRGAGQRCSDKLCFVELLFKWPFPSTLWQTLSLCISFMSPCLLIYLIHLGFFFSNTHDSHWLFCLHFHQGTTFSLSISWFTVLRPLSLGPISHFCFPFNHITFKKCHKQMWSVFSRQYYQSSHQYPPKYTSPDLAFGLLATEIEFWSWCIT